MIHFIHVALSFPCSFSYAFNHTYGQIEGFVFLPNGTARISTLISLNDGQYKTYSQPDGHFTFYNIPPGVHSLDIHDHQFFFSQVKIQLLEQSIDSPKCIEYIYPGAVKQAISHPLKLIAHGTFQYFEVRPIFSPWSLLRNPMALLMLFGVIMMFVMPSMMDNLDEDQKKKFKNQMEMQKDPTKLFSSLVSEFTGVGEADASSSPKKVKRERDGRRLKRE